MDTVDPPMGDNGLMSHHLGQTSNGAFLRAVLSVRQGNAPDVARIHIDRARDMMANDFAALVGESYERAYSDMVRVQQLTELDEVMLYKKALAKKGEAESCAPCLYLASDLLSLSVSHTPSFIRCDERGEDPLYQAAMER